ncbi:DUF2300 domain-containing protein [Aeromonas sanarellii]|uniref:DUF2300 domain-containing protein n=1 Tax=Aeromonas sanarellii TaxID=633415 RepID=UPI0038CFB3DC
MSSSRASLAPARLACNTRAKRSAWLSRLSRRWMTRVSSLAGRPRCSSQALSGSQCGDRPFRVSQTGSVNDSASASRPSCPLCSPCQLRMVRFRPPSRRRRWGPR